LNYCVLLCSIMQLITRLLFFVFLLWGIAQANAQCIVINEIMINAPGGSTPPSCDGGCAPNAAEWTELYNNCNVPVDIGCYVLTDGDWTATIPAGTILQPGDYFVIGSINSNSQNTAGIVDLFLGSCGCTSGTGVGILTNNSEQAILIDASGNIADAVYWGNGQFPVNINSSATVPGCGSQVISVPNATGITLLPSGGGDGCSLARICDGAATWVERCGATSSIAASNGQPPVITFSASNTDLCEGECISFSNNTPGTSLWNWTFNGAQSNSSTNQNPQNICYNSAGSYDVTLELTNACGTFTETITSYINVSPTPSPQIQANGNLTLCPGESVDLEGLNTSGSLQWQLNGNAIAGANGLIYQASIAGDYTLAANDLGCTGVSNTISVVVVNPVIPQITPASPVSVCQGGVVSFSVNDIYTNYQWYLNGNPIPGSNAFSYDASLAGNYTVEAVFQGCDVVSPPAELIITNTLNISISPAGPLTICQGAQQSLSVPAGFDSYQWYFNGLPVAAATTNQLTVNQSGDYTVEVTSGQCIEISPVLTLVVNPIPQVDIVNPTPVSLCNGSSLTLNGIAGLSNYQWFLNGNPIPGAQSQDLIVNSAGNYTLEASLNGCSNTSSAVTVNLVTPNPISIIYQGPVVICDVNPVVLNSTAGFVSYQWLLNGNPLPGATTQAYSISQSGGYVVTGTDANGCTVSSNTLNFNFGLVNVLTIISSTGSFEMCVNEPLQLIAPPGYNSYQWFLNSNAIAGATSSSFTVSQPGSYSFTASNNTLCDDISQLVDVIVHPLPQVTISPASPGNICEGESLLLTANTSAPQLQWLLDGNPLAGAVSNQWSASVSGQYSVNVISANGCSANSAIFTLNVNPIPVLSISGPDSPPCEGESVLLSASGSFTNLQWFNGSAAESISVNSSGTYVLTAFNTNACSVQESYELMLLPVPEVSMASDVLMDCLNGSILEAKGDGFVQWSPIEGLSDANVLNPIAYPEQTTTYTITVSNASCTASDSVKVLVDCGTLFVPNSFTPNNDGLNDVFRVSATDVSDFKLWIYNRWGELIFFSSDVDKGWDGRHNGMYCAQGVYVWLIEARNQQGRQIFKMGRNNGTVTLYR
jgi:gliding motility-associated-like protein